MKIRTFILAGILLPLGAFGQTHYHTTVVSLHPNSSVLEFTVEKVLEDETSVKGTEKSYIISFADRTMIDKGSKETRKFSDAEALKLIPLVDFMPPLTQRLLREWCTYDADPARVIEWRPWTDSGRIDLWGDGVKPVVIVKNGRNKTEPGPTAECVKSGTVTPFDSTTSTDTYNLLTVSSIWVSYAAESAEWWDLGFGKTEELRASEARLW